MSSSDEKAQCLIIGANGLVGRCLAELLSAKGISWTGTFHKRPGEGLAKLDITSKEDVRDLLLKTRPDVVFNCANLAGGVDFCETNLDIAKKFHLDSTITIGAQCKSIGAAMIYISTDYIFDGTKGPYKEDDRPSPLNLYGRLKLAAEDWLKNNIEKLIIVRTTNVYGWDPETVTPNYMMSLYRTLTQGKVFRAPSYLWGNPTYARDLAAAILELYFTKKTGTYHVVGSSFVNRYEWALKACEIFGLDKNKINNITVPPPNITPRPLKSWLNNEKFCKSSKTTLHDLDLGLKLMKKEMPKNA